MAVILFVIIVQSLASTSLAMNLGSDIENHVLSSFTHFFFKYINGLTLIMTRLPLAIKH